MRDKLKPIFQMLIIGLLSFWLILGEAASAVSVHDHVTYTLYTGEALTMAWDVVENAETYEVQLLRFEWDNEVVQEWVGITTTTQEISPPKAGMYIIQVRACNEAGCSDWAISTSVEFASVDGEPRSWWVYGYTAPPGPIVIGGSDDPQGGGP